MQDLPSIAQLTQLVGSMIGPLLTLQIVQGIVGASWDGGCDQHPTSQGDSHQLSFWSFRSGQRQWSSLHLKPSHSPTRVMLTERVPLHWLPTLAASKSHEPMARTEFPVTQWYQEANTHCPPWWLCVAQYSRPRRCRHCSTNHVSP